MEGRQILMFWYRNEIYAIEARSPAEGAYSEGFIRAKFTQDYCIECPSTGSLFSLKDGSITSWYPNNPVLRALTPADLCRPLDVYDVKLTQDALYVNVDGKRVRTYMDRGGAGALSAALSSQCLAWQQHLLGAGGVIVCKDTTCTGGDRVQGYYLHWGGGSAQGYYLSSPP